MKILTKADLIKKLANYSDETLIRVDWQLSEIVGMEFKKTYVNGTPVEALVIYTDEDYLD